MKINKIILSLVSCISLLSASPTFASADSYSCADGPVDPYDKDYVAHCVGFILPSLPNDACKMVRIDEPFGASELAFGFCVSKWSGLDITKYMIGLPGFTPGKYSTNYSQCLDRECTSSVLAGTDNYTINTDNTITPFAYMVKLNENYGKTYSIDDFAFNDLSMSVSNTDSCQSTFDSNNQLKYCASFTNPTNISKFIKLADDSGFGIVCMNSNTHFGYESNYDASYPDWPVESGSQHLKVYQCDNFQCNNPKLLGDDTVVLSDNNTVDHPTKAFAMDPNYGANCSPVARIEQNRKTLNMLHSVAK
jgi:hypothetical protein